MLLSSFLFFIMKNFWVSFNEEFVFGIVKFSSTYPVWKKNSYISIKTANEYI